MNLIASIKTIILAISLYFNQGYDSMVWLTNEIQKNCSISDELTVAVGQNYSMYYESTIIEDCELCSPLVPYLNLPESMVKGRVTVANAGMNTKNYAIGNLSRIAALYHEMGHVHNRDDIGQKGVKAELYKLTNNFLWLDTATKCEQSVGLQHVYSTGAKIYHPRGELEIYTRLLANTTLLQSQRQVKHYVELGQQLFKASLQNTILGRYLANILRQKDNFWDPPYCEVCQLEKQWKRGKEARADLFAAEKMFLNGRIDALTAIVYFHASSGFEVAGPNDIHPSGIERALMFAGFLDEKGVDVFRLISEFEKEPVEDVYLHNKEYLRTLLLDELIVDHYESHIDPCMNSSRAICGKH